MKIFLIILALGGNTTVPMDTMERCEAAKVKILAALPQPSVIGAACIVQGN